MLFEMDNMVFVEGILAEIGLQEFSNKDKDTGAVTEGIKGNIKVKVKTELVKDGPEVELIVPVSVYVNRLTKKNNEHPSYANLLSLIHDGKSIASVGEELADCVRIGGGKIKMVESTKSGKLVTYPSISASFINIIKPSDMQYKAKTEIEGIICGMNPKLDSEGMETEDTIISLLTVGYNNYAEIVPILVNNPKYRDAIKATYTEGDLVRVAGRLNFSSKTEQTVEEVEIGEPIVKNKTISVSEIILSGINSSKNTEVEITPKDITDAIASRQARIDEKMKKDANGGRGKAKNNEKQKVSLGF